MGERQIIPHSFGSRAPKQIEILTPTYILLYTHAMPLQHVSLLS